MPETVWCLHDASRTEALTFLKGEVRRYCDDYSGDEPPDRYTPTEYAETVAYGISEAEIGDVSEYVPINEWDYMQILAVPNSECECWQDYMRDPGTHECAD